VITAGEPIPDVTVFALDRSAASLRDLAGDGPVLFLFYLFDWSGT
jgi:hypothetical protein